VFVEVWNLARLQPSDGDVEVWIAAVAHRRIGDRNRFHFHSNHCGQDATMRRAETNLLDYDSFNHRHHAALLAAGQQV